jgi:hypothetical protein
MRFGIGARTRSTLVNWDESSHLFWRSVRQRPEPEEAAALFKGTHAFPISARIEVYRSAYWFRQVGVLQETFSILLKHLGLERFNQLASRYIAENPSQSWALEHLGRRFSEYLVSIDEPVLAQIAHLEQQQLEVLMASDDPVLNVSALDISNFENTHLSLGEHVKLIPLNESAVALLPPDLRQTYQPGAALALWRKNFHVHQLFVSKSESGALLEAKKGAPIPVLCHHLSNGAPGAEGAQKAFASLVSWFGRDWVSGLKIVTALMLFVLVSACGAPDKSLCIVAESAGVETGESVGPLMRPGTNCLRCHQSSGSAARVPFSVGGTIFPKKDSTACSGVSGVTIQVTDKNGKSISLLSNAVGNFYSTEKMEPPLKMEAMLEGRTQVMPGTSPTGGCALCHSWPDAVSALGRIRVP